MKIVVLACRGGQRHQSAPRRGVVRDLYLALGCAGDPVQLYAVEGEAAAKIDVDPLLVEARALPRAGEAVGAADFYTVGGAVKLDLSEFEGDVRRAVGVGEAELDAVVAAAVRAVEQDRRAQHQRAVDHVRWIIFGGQSLS